MFYRKITSVTFNLRYLLSADVKIPAFSPFIFACVKFFDRFVKIRIRDAATYS